MIFSHTLESVLNQSKTQTSRRWKDTWHFNAGSHPSSNRIFAFSHVVKHPYGRILSGKKRLQYEVGQTLAIQPARGKKSVGRIEITNLEKRNIRNFTAGDIGREGFGDDATGFYLTWLEMHNPTAYRALHLLSSAHQIELRISEGLKTCDMALVIGFKLVEVY